MKTYGGLAAALLFWAAAAAAADVKGDAGALFTSGSGGYHRLNVYGDGNWKQDDLEPYVWGSWSVDNDLSQLGLGGGAWRDLDDDVAVKGGAGVYAGHLIATDQRGLSYLLETGVEKLYDLDALGAEYRLTAGTIGGPAEPIRYGNGLHGRGGAETASDVASYYYNEVAGYGRMPAGAATLGLRVALGLPSYSRSILSEELSVKAPVVERLRARGAVTFEQAATRSVYFSLGAEWLF